MSDRSLRHSLLRFGTPIAFCALLLLTMMPRVAVAANTAPTALSQALSAPYNTPIVITMRAVDPDPNTAFTFAIYQNPTRGAISSLNPNTGAIVYTPNPGFAGDDSFSFTASDGQTSSAPAMILIAVGAQPTVSLSAQSLGFGNQPVGTSSAPQTVTLTNTSAVPVTIASITASGDYTRTYTCLTTLDPGASCSISVTFSPTATEFRGGTLSITSSAAGSPQTVSLGGYGTGNAALVILRSGVVGAGGISLSPPGTATGPDGATTYPINTVATATAQASPGTVFIGWTFDGASAGWANPLTITMNANHSLVATFAPIPAFSDLPSGAMTDLAARNILRGYGDGRVGPADPAVRAQMAALICRAMGWEGENWGNPFTDQGYVDAALWRNVGTIAHYGVAFGYGDMTFQPTAAVLHAQTISFISRAMVTKGYWQQQPDNPNLYTNVPASSGHRSDIATFVYYAGALPDYPTNGPFPVWNQPATRSWFSRALYQALDSYFGVDRVP